MSNDQSKQLFILGVTSSGKLFRPSDWAERLAGVMSSFRPGAVTKTAHLSYSPWCTPTSIGKAKCVILNEELKNFDLMAWDFCCNFAKDNALMLVEECPTEHMVKELLQIKQH